MGYESIPRWQQRLGGGLIATVGGGGTAWVWHAALSQRYFYPKASVLMPAFLILGLALVASPGYREERVRRGEDISNLSGVELITPRWWAALAVALVAGFGNFLLLRAG